MRLQKWLVRGLVFTLLLALVGMGILYQRWTDPTLVREQVIKRLGRQFPGADVTLEGARFRILGGVELYDLRLIRRDDPARGEILYVPSAIVYHDKEKILDGKLALRKVVLDRPRLRLVREKDGTWNFMGLGSAGDTGQEIPTMVVHAGTLIFEDKSTQRELPPMQLTAVEMTVIDDPADTVKFEAKGKSRTFGHVEIIGNWQRDVGRWHITAKTLDGRLTKSLTNRLAAYSDCKEFDQMDLQGKFNLHLNLSHTPDTADPFPYDLKIDIANVHGTHPNFPLPLENLRASLLCAGDTLNIQNLKATSGNVRIEGHGSGLLADFVENHEGELSLHHLDICPTLCDKLTAEIREVHQLFAPRGPVTVKLNVKKAQGKWQRYRVLIQPEKISLRYEYFPYPLNQVRGMLDIDMLAETTNVDLSSEYRGKSIRVVGTWNGFNYDADANLQISGTKIPLDKDLIAALPADSQSLARSFHPSGFGDVQAIIKHKPGQKDFHCEYHVDFYDARVTWNEFPYPLDNVTGRLDILPGYWEFKNFRGRHRNGWITVNGYSLPVANANGSSDDSYRIVIDLAGQNIGIDGDLRAALISMPHMAKVWDTFSPTGKMNFRARIDNIPGRDQDMDISVAVGGCRVEPSFYRYPFHDVSATFHYSKNRLDIRDLQASHNESRLFIKNGTIDLSRGGGYYADLKGVQGNPIYPNDGFIAAMPPRLRETFAFLDFTKPVAVQTRLIIAQKEEPGSPPDIFWDGLMWMRDSKLNLGVEVDKVTGVFASVGRHDGSELHGVVGNALLEKASLFGQPFKNIHAKIEIKKKSPDSMLIGLKAPIYGGDISGQVRVDFHSSMRYEMNLTASRVNLSQFGRHNFGPKSELEGLGFARLHLTGRGTSLDSLDGNGTIDIPQGKLLNLPFILDLLKFLGLRWPDHTAFEEAHAGFSVQGRRLAIKRLDLWGNAVSLSGQGELNLDGTDVQLDFYPSWARVEQLLPAPLRKLSPAVSKNLLKIEARGKIGAREEDLKFHKRPIPVIVDPLRELRNRLVDVDRRPPPMLKQSLGGNR